MRKETKRKTRSNIYAFSFLVLFLLISTILAPYSVIAQEEKPLELYISDYNNPPNRIDTDAIVTFLEGKEYDLVAMTMDEEGESPVVNATITVPWLPQYIATVVDPVLTITIPYYEEYPNGFSINVSKSGYQSLEQEAIIIIGVLDVTTVQTGDVLSVQVTDDNENAVSEASVYIQDQGAVKQTDNEGKASLAAPFVDANTKVYLVVHKDGYEDVSKIIPVTNVGTSAGESDWMLLYPIIIAVIAVVIFMVVVRLRKRKKPKPIDDPDWNFSSQKERSMRDENQSFSHRSHEKERTEQKAKDTITVVQTDDPRIEEIRLHRTTKQKETTIISDEAKPTEETQQALKTKPDQWFEGTDELRYKVDKLTGKIDEQGADKWFEGKKKVQEKIDEAISKKNKKKEK
ncbi:MAG: hypothetical protein NT038_07465 [Euryarchaeota archaeon]|nr:hypothetical protein [Euryarchaeota archaeon]